MQEIPPSIQNQAEMLLASRSLVLKGVCGLPLLTVSIVLFFISVTTTAVWTTQNSDGAGGLDPQWWQELHISGPGKEHREDLHEQGL